MLARHPSLLSVLGLFLVAFLHIAAIKLSLYWEYPWFDMVVHATAGVVIGSLFVVFRRYFAFAERHIGLVAAILSLSFVVGALWEVAEVLLHATFVIEGYWLDTATDMTADLAGSLAAYAFFRRHLSTQTNIFNS